MLFALGIFLTFIRREQQAQLDTTWQILAQCYAIGYEKIGNNNAVGIHRTLNAAIMLGRNLVSVSSARNYAWDSGAPARILDIMTKILEFDTQTAGGNVKKVMSGCKLYLTG